MTDINHGDQVSACHSEVRTAQAVGNSSSLKTAPSSVTAHCTTDRPQRLKRFLVAKIETAEALDSILEEQWKSGRSNADAFSNRAIAERLFDADEKTVRGWRNGTKPVPMAALLVLPTDVAEDLAEALLSQRRELAGDRRSTLALDRAIDRVRQYVAHGVLANSDRQFLADVLRESAEKLLTIAGEINE